MICTKSIASKEDDQLVQRARELAERLAKLPPQARFKEFVQAAGVGLVPRLPRLGPCLAKQLPCTAATRIGGPHQFPQSHSVARIAALSVEQAVRLVRDAVDSGSSNSMPVQLEVAKKVSSSSQLCKRRLERVVTESYTGFASVSSSKHYVSMSILLQEVDNPNCML